MAPKTILVAEDNVDTALSLKDVLETFSADVVVRIASNGSEALDRLSAEPVDLLIADHRLPGMSGADLIKHLDQTKSPTRRILVSAFMTPGQCQALGEKVGADVVFRKPFDIPDLRNAVLHLLNQPSSKTWGRRTEDWGRVAQP